MRNLYFTKSLAETLCNDFQFLKNQIVPNQIKRIYFKDIIVVEINKDEYDVVLISDLDSIGISHITKSELQGLIKMRLFDYFEAENINFDFCRYGMGYSTITTQKDSNGIDLFL